MGKTNLERVLLTLENKISVIVHWHPYQIDPATPTQGEDFGAYNQRRWNDDGQEFLEHLRETSQKNGPGLEFKDTRYWPNTLLSNALLCYAEKTLGLEAGTRVKSILFRMSYEEGKNVSDMSVILDAASEMGLDKDATKKYIEEEGKIEATRQDREAKEQCNIHSVPQWRITRLGKKKGQVILSGAQSVKQFQRAFKRLLE